MPDNAPDNRQRCPHCGSTHFLETDFRQYQVFPSSGTGGGFHPYKRAFQVLLCLCGHPLAANRQDRRDTEAKSFADSLQAALDYRERNRPDHILAQMTAEYVSHDQLQTVAEQVSNLASVMQQMQSKAQELAQKKKPG